MQGEEQPEIQNKIWVLFRLARTLGLLLLLGLTVMGFHHFLNLPGEGITITLSILVALPYSLGALAAFLNNPTGDKAAMSGSVLAVLFVTAVLLVGGVVLREGVICMVILLPIWIGAAAAGGASVLHLHEKARERSIFTCSLLASLPFLFLFGEAYLPLKTSEYTVSRSVIIEAATDDVWKNLSSLNDIKANEGRWNITQNLLGVAKPRSANVVGKGEGAVRHAMWGEKISFEEHIYEWEEGQKMRWNFKFPNDSVHAYTDRHISPDGHHLKILNGGYSLTALNAKQTELFLDTTYAAATPVNFYSAAWGELFLGDIQNNVLRIVKDRTETRQSRDKRLQQSTAAE